MGKYTIHEEEVKAVSLPGREHKMIIGQDNFGKSAKMCFGVAYFPANQHARVMYMKNRKKFSMF